jgi:hypothetical protein
MYDFLAADGQLLNVSRKQQRPSTAGIWVLPTNMMKIGDARCPAVSCHWIKVLD